LHSIHMPPRRTSLQVNVCGPAPRAGTARPPGALCDKSENQKEKTNSTPTTLTQS
jgi:hypothetical protein